MRRVHRSEAGYAMIDALVALLLLSFLATTLLLTQSISSRAAMEATTRSTALSIANSVLSSAQASQSGRTQANGRDYEWVVRVSLSPVEDSPEAMRFVEKRVTIEWQRQDGEKSSMQLSTAAVQ
ncbi:hypothetical protein D1222_08175 [Henriciella algicola]|uniref:Type II secretion system protein n=2 Tax=Henriciella algicola TaxID=1608422 RepID=A0A399RH51_9PROT|nr:hypothetical protein D1222_08175 [Henriciella algicola]